MNDVQIDDLKYSAFVEAVHNRDLKAMKATLASDILFYTVFRPEPFLGRDAVGAALEVPARLFAFYDTFKYIHILDGPGGWQALFFRGKYEDEDFEGVDLVRLDAAGLICEFRISMRPVQVVQKMAVAAHALAGEILHL